jgi:hypothetical protein
MKITLLHPSRGRATKAKSTLDFWIKNASGKIFVEHILSLDEDDPEIGKYKELFSNLKGSAGIVGPNTCVVEATNSAAEIAKGDVLIYLSDDFKCPKDWDLLISEYFEHNLNEPALLKVDDCLQKFKIKVLTIPIMNAAMYKKLGYFWHPGYKSMFVDEDLFWVSTNNGWMMEAEELKFPHEHCTIGKAERDETYIRSEKNWDQGKEFFALRKSQNFPI